MTTPQASTCRHVRSLVGRAVVGTGNGSGQNAGAGRGNACRVETFYPGFMLGEQARRLEAARCPDNIFGELKLLVDRARADSGNERYFLRIAVLEDLAEIIPLAIREPIEPFIPHPANTCEAPFLRGAG